MNRWTALAADAELRRYVLWRLRRNPAAIVSIPQEWMQALAARRVLKAAPAAGAHEPLSGASGPCPLRLWPAPERVPAVVAATRAQAPDQSAAIVSQAEEILEGSIHLRTGSVCDWESGRCDASDPEHRDSFNRQYHVLTLAWAWALTADARFANAFSSGFGRWTAAHPPSADNPAWGAYTVSERIVTWGQAVPLLWNAPGFQGGFLTGLVQRLETEARWLADRLETAGRHNHLINNGRALFLYGAWFGDRNAEARGWQILAEELRRQVAPDGVLAEQSIAYHLLLTRTYVEALLTRLTADAVEPDIAERIRGMVAAARAFLRPDGSVALIGDSSPDVPVDALGRFILGAAPTFRSDEAIGPIVAAESIERLSALLPRASDGASKDGRSLSLPDSGYAIRSTSRQHLVVHADPRGLVLRHGHADALGLTLWAEGGDVIVDPGNSSYVPDEWLAYFRGSRAHNAPVVDDLPVTPYDWVHQQLCSAEYRDAHVRLSTPREVNGWWTVVGAHRGYARMFGNATVARRIVASDDVVWITDWVDVPGRHRCRVGWVWATLRLQSEAESGAVLFDTDGGRSVAVQFLADAAPVSARWISGQRTPVDGWRSPSYGTRKEALTSVCERDFVDSVRLDTCVSLRGDRAIRLTHVDAAVDQARLESVAWAAVLRFDPSTRDLIEADRQPAASS